MKLGMHMSMAGGISKVPPSAVQLGCEAYQIFAGNPNSWHAGTLKLKDILDYKENLKATSISQVVLHTAYLLNLASPDPKNYTLSTEALIYSLQRADQLGAPFVVTHIGSHRKTSVAEGVQRIIAASQKALDQSQNSILLLEGGAGAGDAIGSRFDEMHKLISGLSDYTPRIGICLDTAHLWGAGYDLSSPDKVKSVLEEFDHLVGLSYLKVFHLNDTKVDLGSHKDRHAQIGTGRIGKESFQWLVRNPLFDEMPGILETPWDTWEESHEQLLQLLSLREIS